MKPFIENLVNDNTKKITRLNFNYFFLATIFIVLLNIILQAANALKYLNVVVLPNWNKFSLNNLLQSLFNSYLHFNWQHCLLNMLYFLITGLYLERKMGSIRFIMFIFILSLFTAFASSANAISLNWRGFSGVNYGLYGYIIINRIEFLFVLCIKNKRTRFNIIMGAVILASIYFAMCFCGGTSKVAFEWYPYDLFNNLGHASGFIAGIIFGLYEMTNSLLKNKCESK